VNTPNDMSDTQINALVDFGTLPTLNAETLANGRKNEIDLKRFPHIKPEYDEVPTGIACWDGNSYDGPGCPIGYGPTPQCALLNLLEQL